MESGRLAIVIGVCKLGLYAPPTKKFYNLTIITMEKRCHKCWNIYPLTSEFRYRNSKGKNWFYSTCKACKKNSIHLYHKTDAYREIDRERKKKYRERIREHSKEHKLKMGYDHIHKRTLRKIKSTIWYPEQCPICWEITRIIAHHVNYDKWNEIVFCCNCCHQKIHRWEITELKIIDLMATEKEV